MCPLGSGLRWLWMSLHGPEAAVELDFSDRPLTTHLSHQPTYPILPDSVYPCVSLITER